MRNKLFSAIVIMTMCSGCMFSLGSKRPSGLVETDRPNTFKMEVIPDYKYFFKSSETNILGVRVHECQNINDPRTEENILWEIVANKPVKANGFEVTVGKVPEGFIQRIPPDNETFEPISGQMYWISPNVSNEQIIWPSTFWTAD